MASDLERRLRAHSDYFESLFSLVPVQYRTAREEEGEERSGEAAGGKKTRFWHLIKGAGQLKSRKKPSTEAAGEPVDSETSRGGVGFGVDDRKSLSLSELRRRLHDKMKEVSLSKKEGDEGARRRRKRRREMGEGAPDKKQLRIEEKEKRKKEREIKQNKLAVAAAQTRADETSDDPKFSFNRFEFSDSGQPERRKNNYRALVAKAEAKQKKLQELLEEDKERGEGAREKEGWSRAVRMARGEKVRDDPTLLRKTVKRLEKKKKSHVKKWKERARVEQERQEATQRKRQQNIRERVDKIKAKKTRKRAKKR